jgi:glucokinase
MTKKDADNPVIGVDLGGTKILAGVVAPDGALLGQSKRATKPSAGVEAVVDRMAKTVREAIEAAGLKVSDMAGLGTGAPGPLDPDRGIVLHTPNLPWVNVPLASMLSERLDDLPVFIENDVNLGTYGESVFGAGKGAQDVIGIFVGTGIGGGLVLEGRLRQGWRKACAEIGHMTLMAEGPVCGCGKRGCAEALASRTAIERDIWAGIKMGRESLIPELLKGDSRERLTSGALAEAYLKGDPLVTEVLGKTQFYLGLLTASVVNFVDPEMVILGGGVIEALGESFLVPIRAVAYQYFINQDGAKDVAIVPAKLGDNAALLGAAAYARTKLAKS